MSTQSDIHPSRSLLFLCTNCDYSIALLVSTICSETKQTAYEWIHTEEDNQICNKEVSKGRIYTTVPCYTGHYINDTDPHSCFAYLILKYLWFALHGYTMMLFSCTECDTNINRNTGLSDEYTTFQWIYFQSNNCTMWDKWSFDILAYLKCRYKI